MQESLHYYGGEFLPRDRFEDWAATLEKEYDTIPEPVTTPLFNEIA